MAWRPTLKKRWRLILVCGVVLYALLWWLTHIFGVPQVRRAEVKAMPVTSLFMDVSGATGRRAAGPQYFCRAAAQAPFLVRVEQGWVKGPLNGDGGSVLYLWFFGVTIRTLEYSQWAT
jgi:hypothetical protein